MDIKKIVNSLVKKHKTRNPFEIIKGMNVILVPVPLEGVRGFYQYFQRNNIIYIDDFLPENEQILVCAHELGHMLLHKKANALLSKFKYHAEELPKSKVKLELYERVDTFGKSMIKSFEPLSGY